MKTSEPLVTGTPAAARAAVTTSPRPALQPPQYTNLPLVTGAPTRVPPVVTIQGITHAITHALHIILTIQTDNAATPTCRPGRPTANSQVKAYIQEQP